MVLGYDDDEFRNGDGDPGDGDPDDDGPDPNDPYYDLIDHDAISTIRLDCGCAPGDESWHGAFCTYPDWVSFETLAESNCEEVEYPWCESQHGCTYDYWDCECVDAGDYAVFECGITTQVYRPCERI